jgi:hypothetical protein
MKPSVDPSVEETPLTGSFGKNLRRLLDGILALAVIGSACSLSYLGCSNQGAEPASVKEFEDWIDASLPVGTPKAKVETWLKEHNISYSNEIGGMKAYNDRNFIHAGKITRGKGLELGGDVTIIFFFDDKDRLKKRVVSKYTYST